MILFNYVQNRYFLNSSIRKSLFYNVMYYENILKNAKNMIIMKIS
jgi:hypothetical protein